MDIEHSHAFGQEEARARVKALAEYMSARHGMQVAWTGDDSFRLSGKYKVVAIDATVAVGPDKIEVHGKDPGMLWRAPAKAYIAKKLEQYLDPSVPPDSLPRA